MTKNVDIPSSFRDLRTRTKMSMNAFAKLLGYSGASSIQRYENPDLYKKPYLPPEIIAALIKKVVGLGQPPITEEDIYKMAAWQPANIEQDLDTTKDYDLNNGTLREQESGRFTSGAPISNKSGVIKKLKYKQASVGQYILTGNYDTIQRPKVLDGVDGAYAISMPDESMAPRYHTGETLYAHPSRPPRPGIDYVLVKFKPGYNGRDAANESFDIFKLRNVVFDRLELTKLSSDNVLEVPQSEVEHVHLIAVSSII